jgi:arylsulfatase A-like enzyme
MLHHVTGNRVARSAPIAGVLAAMLATLLVGSGDASAVGRGPEPRSPAAADAPNVLIIVTDDQRPDTMKFMPQTRKLFGRRGVTFERAFATTPVCCPFRASLMTGQYAHNSGVRRNEDALMLNHDHTLQRYFSDGGYRTALTGKFLNNWKREDPPPYFERFVLGNGYTNSVVNVDGTMKTISQYLPYYLKKRAVRMLRDFEADDARPWFMLLTPSSPHGPSTPAPEHRSVRLPKWQGNPATFEKNLSDKPPTLYPNNTPVGVEARPLTKHYRNQVRALLAADRIVDEVFGTLRELGENGNTLAFFMSDNGFLMGEHGLRRKRFPYPMSQEVPLHMRWPDARLPIGRTDHRIVANIDVLPTALGAAGLEGSLEHEVDGMSLLGSQQRDRLLLEQFADTRRQVPTWASLITDREQYTEYYQLDGETRIFTEYYDVLSDPWYLKNTLGDDDPSNDPRHPTLLQLENQLEADRECAGATCP